MSKTKSIWDKVATATPSKKENVSNELTDEIRAFREKQKEFAATNDHQTYFIVCWGLGRIELPTQACKASVFPIILIPPGGL